MTSGILLIENTGRLECKSQHWYEMSIPENFQVAIWYEQYCMFSHSALKQRF